jgi:hypothetical protein
MDAELAVREQAQRFDGRLDSFYVLMDETTDRATLEAELGKVREEVDTWIQFLIITQPESVPGVIQRMEQEETQ